jgi:polyhydroxyalkanoate synthase
MLAAAPALRLIRRNSAEAAPGDHPCMSSKTVCPAGHGPAPLDLPLKLAIARLSNGLSPSSLLQASTDWWVHLMVSPTKQAELATSAAQKSLLWLRHVLMAAQGECEECVAARPQDKRFARADWSSPAFHALAQAFLLQEQWWAEATHCVRGVSHHHEDVTAFVARQWLDMVSPSNFPVTNPQVLRHTLATGGLNLAQGFSNWLRDAAAVATGGRPRGVEDFEPGEAVAATPGQVVHRNHLAELIRYEPATKQVDKEPLLIVPSWIMKFYILDLTPQDSLVKYLVEQGHTVYMLSWRNPGSEDAGLGMEDYVRLGVLEAIAHIRSRHTRTQLHAMGYCLGGTLLAIAAAWLAARGEHPLKTVSLLAAQVDFQEPGELGLFMDESQVAFLEDLMAERGYLDGRQMAGAFQLINSKDLVWSKLVHEYLMGASTPMTALRAWNADATRMPARMHSEYLRALYLRNDLAQGRYKVLGQTVSLRAITTPLFVVATERDHVSPWKSVYRIQQLVNAPVSFVLASGGHNVGIVSPPSGPAASAEASYRFGHRAPDAPVAEPDAWLQHAGAPIAGSWWPRWHEWLRQHASGARVKARPVQGLREGNSAVAAPGTYVFQR